MWADGKSVFLLLPIVVVFSLSIPTGCLSSALFVFGDSFFDPGNNNYINTITDFQANHWPYGQSYFSNPSGRFSDGRLIPDFIAEYAKLPPIPAYLEPSNKEYTHGANFASGGAGTLIDTYAGFVVDLHTQLRHFGDLVNHYRQNLGDTKARQMLSSAVYLFSCGSNDYISPVVNNQSIYYQYTHQQYVDMVIGNLTTVIKGIYEVGGRRFGFLNVPPLGCWPAIRLRQPGNICSKEIDDVIRLHNQALARKLENLETHMEGFMLSKLDFYTSMSNRMKNPSQYGFKEGETACCGSGPFGGVYSCGGMRRIKEYEVCDNVLEYLFFDSYHPNELASRQFAEMFWNGDSIVTEPNSLEALFDGAASTTFLVHPNNEL
ncbi:putative GDSL lipase/esterase, SGNH hydrolase superfamily, GDSL esterase/lipase GLIP1-5/GLL25 [Helianthus annuus]|nr:putative GDSL lipase/esterase, SGNH hydrolase superfamily, GDSL esterase/lipase GLIP1-5/GLL25 [Helianthus annuus]KAJ0544738.1 putative GDSL lipase/esterase, SGNH hydrolase superfamily [Helianthus annuus]KAJ0709738.1 putative GDSL lipase/esterase, SGNH hydrolase superfamily, GDSL esterase/lipase GLIP1-5/GLL25 [Helianthus annuus]KAJ0713608.1 putative GDSL lipase/esterase, SGNH hydrolase superfamily [Helianthus annuus]